MIAALWPQALGGAVEGHQKKKQSNHSRLLKATHKKQLNHSVWAQSD